MELYVAFHDHPLILSYERTPEEAFGCGICCDPVCGLSYSCRDCVYTLHKRCAETPSPLQVPAHPHPLTLSFDKINNLARCNICNYSIYEYANAAYVCLECQSYHSHIACATVPNLDMIELYGLEYSPEVDYSGTETTCVACGVLMFRNYLRSVNNGDKCLHVRCAFLPPTVRVRAHRHVLALLTRPCEKELDLAIDELYCDICETERDRRSFVYYCAACDFVGHLSCANAGDYVSVDWLRSVPVYINELKDYYQDSFIDDLDTKPFLKWKKANESLGKQALDDVEMEKTRWIEREKKKEEEQLPILKHFLHQEHPLVLFNEPINYSVFCSACCNPIYGMTYICQECKFYLHVSCARLPREIWHWDHEEHPLKLMNQSLHHFICNFCKGPSFALSYCCNICGFEVDFQCAFVNREFVRRIHKHLLHLRRHNRHHEENVCEYLNQKLSAENLYKRGPFFRPPPACIACGYPCEGARFECRKCKVYVHPFCSLLKTDGSSSYHRHPLILDYHLEVDGDSSQKDEKSEEKDENPEDEYEDSEEEDGDPQKEVEESEEEYCDACETERNPKHWIYSCRECREYDKYCFVAHVACANPMKETIPFKTNSNV